MKTSRHSKGLTMVELMTVVAILVLSLVLVAPYIGKYLDERKVRNVAESLEYGMLKTISAATEANVSADFIWDGTGTTKKWTIEQMRPDLDASGNKTGSMSLQTVETFDWGGGDANWSSVSVIAVRGGTPPTTSTSAAATFDSMRKVVFPDPSATPPSPQPPDWFDVCGLSGSRKLRVTVAEGGVRVCDPALPQVAPKGCKGTAGAKPVTWSC